MKDHEIEERTLAYLSQVDGAFDFLGGMLRPDHFSNEFYALFFRELLVIVKRIGKAPSLQELASHVMPKVARQPIEVQTMMLNFLKNLYSIQVTQLTGEQVAEYIVATEMRQWAKEVLTPNTDIKKVFEAGRQKWDRLEPLFHGRNDPLVRPLEQEYRDKLLKLEPHPKSRFIPLGYKGIDGLLPGGGPMRQELVVIMAPTGQGKTSWLISTAVNQVEEGYRVLYVALDDPEQLMVDRALARISDLPVSEFFVDAREKRIRGWMASHPAVSGDRFILVPMMSLQVNAAQIRHHLIRAERQYGKVDVLIVDYGDIMASTTGQTEMRHRQTEVFDSLRAVAKMHDCLSITATQSHRGALDREVITLGNVSESYSKTFSVSLFMSICRTEAEKMLGKCRINILKNRRGADGIEVPFRVDLDRAKYWENPQDGGPINLSSSRVWKSQKEKEEGAFEKRQKRKEEEPPKKGPKKVIEKTGFTIREDIDPNPGWGLKTEGALN